MPMSNFRPSIHGWPFPNSYDYNVQLPYGSITLPNLGYCGGMCWTALARFYNATLVARNPTTTPQQGQPLYDEIYRAQLASLPLTTLDKIIEWQASPDLSHRTNALHSLGYRTQQEWPRIKASLDNMKPVTLTLIASSNDFNPLDLRKNHRVVAYAYDEREPLSSEYVYGTKHAGIKRVSINIYDPNYCKNDEIDDVELIFFTGCDDSWIGLRHSMNDEFHGFFLDDQARAYTFADPTALSLDDCLVTGVSAPDRADVDLTFSWKCRFIPYFCVSINGRDWQFNDKATTTPKEAKWQYPPEDCNQKQCAKRIDSLTVKLKAPRELLQIGVRLLDNQAYEKTVEVDARPAILCLPYVHTRASREEPEVCDAAITDADLFIKDPAPTDIAIQMLDTSPFRWVNIQRPGIRVTSPSGSALNSTHLETVGSQRLGNIKVPIYANFIEKNLALPTTITGTRKILRTGQPTAMVNLTFPTPVGQKVFDGFTSNPPDYDNDTNVELTYQAKDRFGTIVQGSAKFFGKSIIYETSTLEMQQFDPQRLARLEIVALELVERGLIDTAIALPSTAPGLGGIPPITGSGRGPLPPQPFRIDPGSLLVRLHADTGLSALITQKCKTVWSDPNIWKSIANIQKEVRNQSTGTNASQIVAPGNLKLAKAFQAAELQKYDAIVIELFAQEGIKQLSSDASIIAKVQALMRGVGLPAVPHIP